MYEYKCPDCKWEGTRITTIEDRDDQECDQSRAGGCDPATCDAKLVREEISANARMSYNWSNWQ